MKAPDVRILTAIVAGFFSLSMNCLAETTAAPTPAAASSLAPAVQRRHDDPYQRWYISASVARNFPEAYGDQFLVTDKANPILSYWYNLDGDWMIGFFGQFKMFKSGRLKGEPLPIWTIGHDIQRSIRIWHPLHFLVGGKLLYLMPTQEAKLPLRRSEEQPSEIGIAISGNFALVLFDRWLVTAGVNRWRGTGTQRLQGSEIQVGLAWAPSTY